MLPIFNTISIACLVFRFPEKKSMYTNSI